MSFTPGLWPREEIRPATSLAEVAVYKALRAGLPPGWSAWHSLRIRDRNNHLGEGDFVLAHPERGALVLEVKGGAVEQRDGRWYSNGIALDKAPLDQANGYVKRLAARCQELGYPLPAFGAAACFPDVPAERQPSEDDLANVVLGKNHLAWLAEALPGVADRALPEPRDVRVGWMEQLHRLWGESWVPTLSLGMRARDVEERRFALDEGQLAVLDGVLENSRVLVRGGAGSGKTLVASEAARRAAERGERVLLLCFTQPLQHWLAARLQGSGVEVQTISGFAKRLAESRGKVRPFPADPTDATYWSEVLLEAAAWVERSWDLVVVDEAQDLQPEAWLLVEELTSDRKLWAFEDPAQRFWEDRSPPERLFGTRLTLRRGRRSPSGVEAYANRWAGLNADESMIQRARASGVLTFVGAPSTTSLPQKIGEEIDRLLSSGLQQGDIGIVSLRGRAAADSLLASPHFGRHEHVSADHAEMEGRLVADSFLRWKGLERPAIIVVDLPCGDRPGQFGVRMYVALTRALVCARVAGLKDQAAQYGFSPAAT
jgi:hypothetical protein